MSEQRRTIHVCDCGDAYDSTSFTCGFCGPAKETVVVPESELSLSLAREQRLREALAEIGDEANIGNGPFKNRCGRICLMVDAALGRELQRR